mmetsp:Transcript_2511/g.6992  ORF Transcript_2511/g.6992 Transcript_2511/m.6992 type:complete len:119 (+) Transcript_2511:356-712(+)
MHSGKMTTRSSMRASALILLALLFIGADCRRSSFGTGPARPNSSGSAPARRPEKDLGNKHTNEFYDPMFGWGLQPVRKAGEEQRNGIDKTAFVKETRAKKQHNTQQQRAQEDQHRKKK